MKVILCKDIFLNEENKCCFTKEFLDKYPQYNICQYFLGVGGSGIRDDQKFIEDLESFGIENAINALFTHFREFKCVNACTDEFSVEPVGDYCDPIKIIELPEETTDWEICWYTDEFGSPACEEIIFIINGKINRMNLLKDIIKKEN